MCRNFRDLIFTHFVVAAEGAIFGSARENGNNHIHNFLIQAGTVKQQHADEWIELEAEVARIVKERAEAGYGSIPVYRTNRFLY
jgi:hypothetical protein